MYMICFMNVRCFVWLFLCFAYIMLCHCCLYGPCELFCGALFCTCLCMCLCLCLCVVGALCMFYVLYVGVCVFDCVSVI